MDAFGDREMVECPFDPTHRMLRKRLQKHILKCRFNHPDSNLQTCPYNVMHLVDEDNFKKHISSCPDRRFVECEPDEPTPKEEVQEEERQPQVPARPQQLPSEFEENWDNDKCRDFDPLDIPVDPNVIRMPHHYHKSERKAFMKQERERLGELPSTPSPPRLNDDDSDDGVDDLRPAEISLKVEPVEREPLYIKVEPVQRRRNIQQQSSQRGHHNQRDWRNTTRQSGKRTHRNMSPERTTCFPWSKYPRQCSDQSNEEASKQTTATTRPCVIKKDEPADDDDEEFERAYSNLPMYGRTK